MPRQQRHLAGDDAELRAARSAADVSRRCRRRSCSGLLAAVAHIEIGLIAGGIIEDEQRRVRLAFEVLLDGFDYAGARAGRKAAAAVKGAEGVSHFGIPNCDWAEYYPD
ncbi:protein of unknown function [Hyphomicrobium sp. MC1]|nr:protein of unknown function [Hyphomicrobium sp. MC1]